MAVAPFIHMEMPVMTNEVVTYGESLDKKEENLQNKVIGYRSEYDNGFISAEEYIKGNDLLQHELSLLQTNNEKLYEEFVNNQRIFDWKSPRKFWIGFGTRLPYLLLTIFLIALFFNVNFTDNKLRKAFVFFISLSIALSIYHITWVFWILPDFPLKTYRWLYLAVCVLIGYGCFNYLEWRRTTIDKLKGIVSYLNHVIIKTTKPYLKNPDKYENEVVWKTLKKVRDEYRG